MLNQKNEFDIALTLRRIMKEINKKIDDIRKPYGTVQFTKEEFFNRSAYGEIKDFPFSKDTYYGYSAIANGKKSRKTIQSIDLNRFYDICKYIDVSADYLLGFNSSKRKELSAEKVKEEFGLSDKSMERLKKIKDRTPEFKGEICTSMLNFILENDTFWSQLDEYMPIYMTAIYYSRQEDYANIARYSISRAFEKLFDDLIANELVKDLNYAKINDEDPMLIAKQKPTITNKKIT